MLRSILYIPIVVIILLLTQKPPVYAADIVINEFLANPPSGQGEWVELYSSASSDVNLIGWKLIDAAGNTKSLDSLGIISVGGFVVYEYSSDGWLNNSSSETITLKDANGESVDNFAYSEEQQENVTTGRSPDGSLNWVVLTSATKGTSNSPPLPTPTPTPTFTPTSTPTPAPTNTPTPTKTSTPTPSPTKVPTNTPKPTENPTITILETSSQETGTVLGQEAITPTPEVVTASFLETNLPKILIAAGGVLLVAAGFIYFKLKSKI